MDRVIVGAVGIGTEKNPPMFMVIPAKPSPSAPPTCPILGTAPVMVTISGGVLCPDYAPFPDQYDLNGVYFLSFTETDPSTGDCLYSIILPSGAEIDLRVFSDGTYHLFAGSGALVFLLSSLSDTMPGVPLGDAATSVYTSCDDGGFVTATGAVGTIG